MAAAGGSVNTSSAPLGKPGAVTKDNVPENYEPLFEFHSIPTFSRGLRQNYWRATAMAAEILQLFGRKTRCFAGT
jgi:hypothetical protein